MMTWINRAQPPLVVIENVSGAPWNDKVEMFEEIGYAADFRRMDTKKFYMYVEDVPPSLE